MDRLVNVLAEWNIDVTDEQLSKFSLYYEMLIEWNEKMNLTSITDKEEVIYKHFLDSSALIKYCDISGKKILDVGTGAGFPGIVLKILNPECSVTLLDSLAKRITFLNEVITQLQLDNIVAIHGRAEDYANNKLYREKYDIVTSRAVANLSTLSEYCIPFTKVNGYFIPYKSGNIDEEIDNAKRALHLLGGSFEKVEKFTLPNTEFDRSLLFIKKVKGTPRQYPRKAGTPSKNPLS